MAAIDVGVFTRKKAPQSPAPSNPSSCATQHQNYLASWHQHHQETCQQLNMYGLPVHMDERDALPKKMADRSLKPRPSAQSDSDSDTSSNSDSDSGLGSAGTDDRDDVSSEVGSPPKRSEIDLDECQVKSDCDRKCLDVLEEEKSVDEDIVEVDDGVEVLEEQFVSSPPPSPTTDGALPPWGTPPKMAPKTPQNVAPTNYTLHERRRMFDVSINKLQLLGVRPGGSNGLRKSVLVYNVMRQLQDELAVYSMSAATAYAVASAQQQQQQQHQDSGSGIDSSQANADERPVSNDHRQLRQDDDCGDDDYDDDDLDIQGIIAGDAFTLHMGPSSTPANLVPSTIRGNSNIMSDMTENSEDNDPMAQWWAGAAKVPVQQPKVTDIWKIEEPSSYTQELMDMDDCLGSMLMSGTNYNTTTTTATTSYQHQSPWDQCYNGSDNIDNNTANSSFYDPMMGNGRQCVDVLGVLGLNGSAQFGF